MQLSMLAGIYCLALSFKSTSVVSADTDEIQLYRDERWSNKNKYHTRLDPRPARFFLAFDFHLHTMTTASGSLHVKRYRPYFTPEEVERLSSKQRGKLSVAREERARQQACGFLDAVGVRCGLCVTRFFGMISELMVARERQ